jgi:hypothetical protein
MPGPVIPQHSGKEFYNPGSLKADYDNIQNQPGLPSVPPPTAGATGALGSVALMPSGPVDPCAPDVLQLIQGGVFKVPFTVTLMKRSGIQTFKSDAGIKTEAAYELCKETIRTPADLLKIMTGTRAEIYRPLNNMSVEFQLLLYLAYIGGAIQPPSAPATESVVETTVEE